MYTVVFKSWMFSFEGRWLFLQRWHSSWRPREKYIAIFDTRTIFSHHFRSSNPRIRFRATSRLISTHFRLYQTSTSFMSFHLLSQSYKTIISCSSFIDICSSIRIQNPAGSSPRECRIASPHYFSVIRIRIQPYYVRFRIRFFILMRI